jgi:predicted ATPase
VTLLFTDIEGSTRLLLELGDRYASALLEHRRVLRGVFQRHHGVEIGTEGDAFFYAFSKATDAVTAAGEGQAALAGGPIRVRIGIHTGEPELTEEGYVGIDLHRAARICSAANGGQVVLSATTARMVQADLRDLGEYRLKDLTLPQRLYQLGQADFPPLRSLNFTNLPVLPTALVGRERELEEGGALLRDHRLVTLIGPGGAGKTRLGLQLAADHSERFRDGVYWIPLAAIRDPQLVESTIAQVMGASDGLAAHLRDKQALLLLDNFEHVIEAAPRIGELLSEATELSVLVTSREPLHLAGEREYLVPPLNAIDAAALFAERARALGVDFQEDPAVADLCRLLDGLPLAIELAAARSKVLSPAQMLARLEQRLDLLTASARDVPERQRTLRATIDWSYELLDQDERELFARLGIFLGGWTLEAAEAVATAGIDTLQSLVDKSLVRSIGQRFSMLEVVRDYAIERLRALGDMADLSDTHAQFFLDLIEQADRELQGDRRTSWMPRVEVEHSNVRAALDRFVQSGAVDLELRLIAAAWRFWFDQGYWDETRQALERAIASTSAPTADRVRALNGAAWIEWRQLGDIAAARRFAEEGLHIGRDLQEHQLVARSLSTLGVLAQMEGDWDRATSYLDESVTLFRSVGDLRGLVAATTNLAHGPFMSGDYRQAADLFAETLSITRQLGDRREAAISLLNLGAAERYLGEFGSAAAHLGESLRVARELGFREVIVESLYGLAAVAAGEGESLRSATLVGAAQRQAEFGHVLEESDRKQLEQTLDSIRPVLGRDAFQRALEEGRAMTLDAAVDYALDGLAPG